MPKLHSIPFALTAALAVTLPAQRMPVPHSGDRVLQLFDLQTLRDAQDPDAAADLAGEHVAAMLRPFVEPALGPGDDLRPLGDRWLAVLGAPAQIACIERLFQQARNHRDDLVSIDVCFFELAAEPFHTQVEPKLIQVTGDAQERYRVVLPKADAPALLDAAKQHGELLQVPRVVVPWLVPAQVDVVEVFSYIKDYELVYGQQSAIANPIIGTEWSGERSRLCAVLLANGNIGLSCEIRHQRVDKPLAETEVDLVKGAAPVKVQLPRITGVHLESVAELAPGSLIVVAAPRSDGRFLVAALTAEVVQPR
ncbi:MAG: hypothetical protein H6835_06085 [Planctomycetes bacterium]|nr:hypothetical protein [Planctomycetota bacterium]